MWKDRAVLVTGGAGFIGSWLSRDLAALGAKVFIVDIKKMNEPLDGVIFVHGDVRDEEFMKSILREHTIEMVFHLAAESIVGEVYKNPTEGLDNNIKGTWQVLEAVRTVMGKKGKLIVASSDKAYGTHEKLPYKEEFALQGENPYDCSKSCADLIARMYAKTYGISVAITRCGNVFGGGDMNFSRLIPDAIHSCYLEKPFVIRSDGEYLRDYVYVKDITAAYLRTAELMEEKPLVGEVFNFGNNAPLRVREVVSFILHAMKKEYLTPIIQNAAVHEIKDQYLDSSKAMAMLKWRPQYTFEDGLKETIAWYLDFFKKNKGHAHV